MCIICVSKSGVRQPSDITLRAMFRRNPHGAGCMYARDGKVTIHKGFMNIEDFLAAVHAEQFTPQDSVVYHFRISTQAGVNAPMTHPFPLSNQPRMMRSLDLTCRCGVAHNGIIRLTSDPDNKRYSDTAIFITDYLSKIIRKKADLRDRVRRYGRTLHRRPRPALQQRQLPDRLVVLSRQLSNQELPPAGGFSCCARLQHVGACQAFKCKSGL